MRRPEAWCPSCFGVARCIIRLSEWLGIANSFALANVFAFAASGQPSGFGIAVLTGIAVWGLSSIPSDDNGWQGELRAMLANRLAVSVRSPDMLGLRVNAIGIGLASLTTALTACLSGQIEPALFPVLAGAAFAGGNVLASSAAILALQTDSSAPRWRRALTNPAVFYGLGYISLGLTAGGGVMLITKPLHNVPALISTLLSLLTTTCSLAGLVTGRLANPTPFLLVAHATALNVVSALATGNWPSAINNLLACHGEVRLAFVVREAAAPPATDRFFPALAHGVGWPLRLAERT